MTVLINDGWLWLSNGTDTMKLACRQISYDHPRAPEITHYEGGISFGYDLDLEFIIVKASGIILTNNADMVIFNDKINDWLKTAPITLQLQRNTGGSFEKFDGTNTTLTVLSKGSSGIQKIAHEDGVTYEVTKMEFEESGARSA